MSPEIPTLSTRSCIATTCFFGPATGHQNVHAYMAKRGFSPSMLGSLMAAAIPTFPTRYNVGAPLRLRPGVIRFVNPTPIPPVISRSEEQRGDMSDDKTRSEVNLVKAEEGRRDAEDLREEADQERDSAEGHRALAEAARKEAEQFRVLAEEARTLREQYREELESVRQEREGLRQAAEEARKAAEEARHATIAAVAATADALSANLAQMQFLEDARNTLRQLKTTKKNDVQ